MSIMFVSFGLALFAQTNTDNSDFNKGNPNVGILTSDQQSNSENDMQITAQIRREIMKQKNFSTYAQNVKIITTNGSVVLKGPVRSLFEQNSIMKFANSVVGASKVTNELTITK